MKANDEITLYQFKGFDMEQYVALYRDSVCEKDITEYQAFVPMADYRYEHHLIDEEEWQIQKAQEEELAKGEIVHREAKRGVYKSFDRIVEKCVYLQDAIIRRHNAKESNYFSLNATILKSVLGNDYRRMLTVLFDMKYIRVGKDYCEGKHSRYFALCCTDFEKVTSKNKTIISYKEKAKVEFDKMKAITLKEVSSRYGDTFTENYLKSLRKIHLKDEEGFNQYISSKIVENPQSVPYYDYVKRSLSDKEKSIDKIDSSGRIYHCLTNLERELKTYLNIDFTLDCRNSHPLLFNYFLFYYYGISPVVAYKITLSLLSLPVDESIHNVGQYFNNYLQNNHLRIAPFANDELYYIYLTSKGELWNDIAARHPEMTRDEVKVKMFQEVFYSNTEYAYEWKEYAVEFQKQFPTVYNRIGCWKSAKRMPFVKKYMDDHHLSVDRTSTSLSISMMNLEAQIFTEILKRLYRKRWNAVHIHDCIVIPEDDNKNHPTREQVKEIMEEVYREYGLCPSFA